MTILEALQTGRIRYAEGQSFDADTRPGQAAFLHCDTPAELPALAQRYQDTYLGAALVRFADELPPSVPLEPLHAWAYPVCVGRLDAGARLETVGALVVWTTTTREDAWRCTHSPQPLRGDAFMVRRHGTAEG